VIQTLKNLFCGRFNCKPEEFEERAFQECLPFHARILAPLIRMAAPRFFDRDFQLIRHMGETKAWRDARTEIVAFLDERRLAYSFLRFGLRLRVSGRKATALAHGLLPREKDRAPAAKAA